MPFGIGFCLLNPLAITVAMDICSHIRFFSILSEELVRALDFERAQNSKYPSIVAVLSNCLLLL